MHTLLILDVIGTIVGHGVIKETQDIGAGQRMQTAAEAGWAAHKTMLWCNAEKIGLAHLGVFLLNNNLDFVLVNCKGLYNTPEI